MSHEGTKIAIGRPPGHAFVYDLATTSARFEASRSAFGTTQFGETISISGDGHMVAIGDRQTNQVVVIQRSVSGSTVSWTQMGSTLTCGVGAADFGLSVALSGDGTTLAVGYKTSGVYRGAARVYRFVLFC